MTFRQQPFREWTDMGRQLAIDHRDSDHINIRTNGPAPLRLSEDAARQVVADLISRLPEHTDTPFDRSSDRTWRTFESAHGFKLSTLNFSDAETFIATHQQHDLPTVSGAFFTADQVRAIIADLQSRIGIEGADRTPIENANVAGRTLEVVRSSAGHRADTMSVIINGDFASDEFLENIRINLAQGRVGCAITREGGIELRRQLNELIGDEAPPLGEMLDLTGENEDDRRVRVEPAGGLSPNVLVQLHGAGIANRMNSRHSTIGLQITPEQARELAYTLRNIVGDEGVMMARETLDNTNAEVEQLQARVAELEAQVSSQRVQLVNAESERLAWVEEMVDSFDEGCPEGKKRFLRHCGMVFEVTKRFYATLTVNDDDDEENLISDLDRLVRDSEYVVNMGSGFYAEEV